MAPDQEEIDQQIAQLAIYRRRLAHDLRQEALLGNTAPFSLAEQIRDAREHIRSIEQTLRAWDVAAENNPNDEPADSPDRAAEPSASAHAGSLAAVDKRALRDAIIQAFSLDELDLLCADIEQDLAANGIPLQVNLELVGGSGKPGKVLNLIGYLDRRGYLAYLVIAVRRTRPGLI